MAKMTLLEMVQDIMSDMDSDEVNSINDSQEATQVAQIIKSTYYNIIDGRDMPFLYELFQLQPILYWFRTVGKLSCFKSDAIGPAIGADTF